MELVHFEDILLLFYLPVNNLKADKMKNIYYLIAPNSG